MSCWSLYSDKKDWAMSFEDKKNESLEGSSFFGSAGVIAFFTLLSRISGLLRDMALAYVLGAGPVADAFVVAFRIPNVFRRFVGEGSLTVSFVPIYKRILATGDEEERRRFLRGSFSASFGVLLVMTCLGILIAPGLICIFAPGFQGEVNALSVTLLRITFPYLFFIGLVAYFMGYLNSHGHFAAPAAAPIFLNLFMIAGALLGMSLRPDRAVFFIAAGVAGSGVVQLLLQIPPAIKRGFPFPLTMTSSCIFHPGVKEVARLLGPSVLAVSAYQINILITNIIASFLPRGSIAYLYYGVRFLELPLGLFVFAISVAILPVLSELSSANKNKEYISRLSDGIAGVLLFTVPATLALIALGEPLVKVFFMRGNFTLYEAHQTAIAVKMYALGMVGVGMVRMLVQAFYSVKDASSPLKSAYIALAVNVIVSILLMRVMAHAGLALATGIAAYAQLAYLVKVAPRSGIKITEIFRSVTKSFVLYIIAAVIMMLALETLEFLNTWGGRGMYGVALLAVEVVAGALIYFAVLAVTREPVFVQLMRTVFQRAKK